ALEPVLAKALSKSPLDRYATCGEFIAAARAAAFAEPRVARGRLALSVALLALAGVVGAAIALAFALPRSEKTVTEVRTVVRKPPPSPPSLDALLLQSTDGRTLNDAAYYLINAGEYARALPFAEKALRHIPKGTPTRG